MYSQVKFNGFRRRLRKRRFWESLVQGRVSNRFSRGFPALSFAVRDGKNYKKTSRLATVGDTAEIYYYFLISFVQLIYFILLN